MRYINVGFRFDITIILVVGSDNGFKFVFLLYSKDVEQLELA